MAEKPHTVEPSEVDPPPEAPEIERRIRISLPHGVGVAMLATIVVLGAIGVFGSTRGTASASGPTLELMAEFPTRSRYRQKDPLRVFVTNRSAAAIDTLTVSFDTAYVAAFSGVGFVPSPARPWQIELLGVAPGETRRVEAELQGERYGRHSGYISASSGSDSTRVEVRTFIFP